MRDATWERAFGDYEFPKETERRIHTRLCKYLREHYPTVRFISTLDGEKFGARQAEAVRALQSHRGVPDMIIFHPTDHHHAIALAIEVKLSRDKVYRKDGTLKKNKHLEEQEEYLDYLRKCGWMAHFGCGYEHCKNLIDYYFGIVTEWKP